MVSVPFGAFDICATAELILQLNGTSVECQLLLESENIHTQPAVHRQILRYDSTVVPAFLSIDISLSARSCL